MHDLPTTDWSALLALVLLLGARHGLDADHLATVDALTRARRDARSRWAPWCGVLFSLGHGGVVMLIALLVGLGRGVWAPPGWVATTGVVISVGFLTMLGLANLWAVWRTPSHELVRPSGLRARWLARLHAGDHPLLVAATGAAFALSFDTLSQAALFAATGSQFGGTAHALALGATFTLGMLLVDGANGLWLARLLERADARARLASRVLGTAVGLLALLVAGLGLARLGLPQVAAWVEDRALLVGLATLLAVTLAYGLAQGLARLFAPAPPASPAPAGSRLR